MADNKNQHYVPRVHLKPFTLDGAGLAVNLLNIDRMKPIQNAPVKNQCSGDYFYGKDERLERAINSIEAPYGEIVRLLMSDNAAVNQKACIVILRFVYLQYVRTEAASRKMAEMTMAMHDVPGSDNPMPSIREAMKNAVQIAMLNFADSMSIVDDLKVLTCSPICPRL